MKRLTVALAALGLAASSAMYGATSAMASTKTPLTDTANCAAVLSEIDSAIVHVLDHRTTGWKAKYASDLKMQTQTQAECNQYLMPATPKAAGPQPLAVFRGANEDDVVVHVPAKDKRYSVDWWYNCPSTDLLDCHNSVSNPGGNFMFSLIISQGNKQPNPVSGVIPNVNDDGNYSAHGTFVMPGNGTWDIQIYGANVNWTVKVYP